MKAVVYVNIANHRKGGIGSSHRVLVSSNGHNFSSDLPICTSKFLHLCLGRLFRHRMKRLSAADGYQYGWLDPETEPNEPGTPETDVSMPPWTLPMELPAATPAPGLGTRGSGMSPQLLVA